MELGYIYRMTFPSGKMYVGQTIQTVEKRHERYKSGDCESQPKLYRALEKYGYESCLVESFEVPASDLSLIEILVISQEDAIENGYNCTIGGEGALKPIEELKYGVRHSHPDYMKIVHEYNRNTEEYKAYIKEYYQDHKEEIKARVKTYREENREVVIAKRHAHYEANKEKILAKHKIYQEEHKEEKRAYDKARREANPEANKMACKACYEKERVIYEYYGLRNRQWRALPKEEKARLRAEYRQSL